MGGVHGWLQRLGLSRYTHAFDKHEVDETVLPLITLDDLKDMGISAVGPRRQIYCAIQKLKGL
jgi:SAM domain (Sterile alpha motif)